MALGGICMDLKATMQDVYRSIHIGIQHQPTMWAFVGALLQVFHNQFAALRTHFRRITGVNQNHSLASFYRFADCQADKLRPRYITFSQSTRPDAVSALQEEVEKYFPVIKTGKNKFHYTVELPKPVTEEVANLFNSLFGRKR